jgi:hypothetical protein
MIIKNLKGDKLRLTRRVLRELKECSTACKLDLVDLFPLTKTHQVRLSFVDGGKVDTPIYFCPRQCVIGCCTFDVPTFKQIVDAAKRARKA